MGFLLLCSYFILSESYIVKPPHVALESNAGLGTTHRQQLTGYWTGLFDGHAGYLQLVTTAEGVLTSGSIYIDSARVSNTVVSSSENSITNLQYITPQSGTLGQFITFDLGDKFAPDHTRHFWGLLGVSNFKQIISGGFTDSNSKGVVFEWHAILNPARSFSKINKVVSNPNPSVSYTLLVNGFSGTWDGAANWANNNQLPAAPVQSTEAALLAVGFVERYNGLYNTFFRPATNQTFYSLYTVAGFHGIGVVTSGSTETHYPWHAHEQNVASSCPDGVTGLAKSDYAVLANGKLGKLSLAWASGILTASYYPADSALPQDLSGAVETPTSVQQIADDNGCYLTFTRPNGEVFTLLFDKAFDLFHGQELLPSDTQSYPVDGVQIVSSLFPATSF